MSFRLINPLNCSYRDSKPSLYRACVNGDKAEWDECEAKLIGSKTKATNQHSKILADEYQVWVNGGRE